MYGCEVLWDAKDAARVQELMEQGTGKPCLCKRGKRCPILPDTLAVVPLRLQLQRNVDHVGQDAQVLGAQVRVEVDGRGDGLVPQLSL